MFHYSGCVGQSSVRRVLQLSSLHALHGADVYFPVVNWYALNEFDLHAKVIIFWIYQEGQLFIQSLVDHRQIPINSLYA